jgi:hypothetical protein
MKRLIYIVALIAIASCNSLPQIGEEVEYNIVSVDYENHEYILFNNLNGSLSAIHSPNCKCKQDKP